MTLFDTGLIQSALEKNVPIITSNVSKAVLSFSPVYRTPVITDHQAPVVLKVDHLSTGQHNWFPNTYPLDRDLSGG